MTSLPAEERSSIIAQIMKKKFGALLDWERPILLHTFGLNDLDRVDLFERKLKETRTQVLNTLEQFQDEAIREIGTEFSDAYRISASEWSALLARAIDQLDRGIPPAIA